MAAPPPVSIDAVERQVQAWLRRAAELPESPAARLLAGTLHDPAGLRFTVGFVDGVIRPDDVGVAAANLRGLAATRPQFVPWYLRAALGVGATASRWMPGPVVAAARRTLRHLVGHLVVDASDNGLGRAIARLRSGGARLNLNLLGEAVLGAEQARRRLAGTVRLLQRPDVDYVSLKVSAIVPPHAAWAFQATVDHVVETLVPLYSAAARASSPTFVNLDMEEYRDLDLTLAVFTAVLDQPDLDQLEAGIVLQAYLPDALAAMQRLQGWAATRRARGGSPIKVRLVKGANLPMERIDAELHGWPLATWPTKRDTDANYKRVLDWALTPDRLANVRLGVAGHNLFDVAYAWELAGVRNARDRVEFEMLLGMAERQARAVQETVGPVRLYTPVVNPAEFDVAIAYLVRRLDEGASSANFMSAITDLHRDPALYARERERFVASLDALAGDDSVPTPNRVQDRTREQPVKQTHFANAADSDPAVAANRAWAAGIAARSVSSTLGDDLVDAHSVDDPVRIEAIVATGRDAGRRWGARPARERATVLRRVAVELAQRRGDLIEVMASEAGKTFDQGDPEVSEAIDFANYYAALAERLEAVDGAIARPVALTVVAPPWNFPVAIPAGSTLAALAAGSAVIVKPAPQARRCGSLMVDALWAAGVPNDALQLVHPGEGEAGRRLIAHPGVDRVILTGSYETAERFRSWRPGMQLSAETSGKNAIVVTPAADLDLAVRDLVGSAFGHAGQKCSAASLAILVGSVATSSRFRRQLVDAVESLVVGWPSDLTSQVGPLIEPARGKLLDALTRLDPGEAWLVRPRRLDADGRLWSPGVKSGVRRGSAFHLTEYFGPVLGLMAAADLGQAIELQNATPYGLTAGLHSLDPAEIATWVDAVEAGNLYVNRGTTGAIVRRQPFGGWKRSVVGPGLKAGGPNALPALTDWEPQTATLGAPGGPIAARLLDLARRAGLADDDLDYLERSFGSDALAWATEFGVTRDVSGLRAERNEFRYRPLAVCVRYEGGRLADLLRVVGAGVRAGASLRVSVADPLPSPLMAELGAVVEAAPPGDVRVRTVGCPPATEAGRLELLPFLREQAISITNHRFGTPLAGDSA